MITFQTAFILICFAVALYLAKHAYLLIRGQLEAMERRKMTERLDWQNTNRSTRKRREVQKMTLWQRYGVTN